MLMLDSYKRNDFFILLKLGLWTEGVVENTGKVRLLYAVPANRDRYTDVIFTGKGYIDEESASCLPFSRKIDIEPDSKIAPKQIGIGISLLDFYPILRDQAEHQIEYIALFSVYRFEIEYPDIVYYIRIRAHEDINPLDGLFNMEMPLKIKFYHNLFPRTSPFHRTPKYVNCYRPYGDRVGRSKYKF